MDDTPARLRAIRERERDAAPGPWVNDTDTCDAGETLLEALLPDLSDDELTTLIDRFAASAEQEANA